MFDKVSLCFFMQACYSSTRVLHKSNIIYTKQIQIHKQCIVFNEDLISIKIIKIETPETNCCFTPLWQHMFDTAVDRYADIYVDRYVHKYVDWYVDIYRYFDR